MATMWAALTAEALVLFALACAATGVVRSRLRGGAIVASETAEG